MNTSQISFLCLWITLECSLLIWDHSCSTYAKLSEKLLFLTPLIRTHTCAYQEVRNISFSENFPCVLNEWARNVDTLLIQLGKHPNTIKNPKREQDDLVRSNVRKSLRDILVNRCKDDQMAINLEALGRICIKIEAELLKLFGETGHKYKTKYRSLIFNLKDTQNKVRVFGNF